LNRKQFQGNDLAKSIYEIVKDYTCFPEILLNTQLRKFGKTSESITAADLPELAEAIGKALLTFTNPTKSETAKQAILKLR